MTSGGRPDEELADAIRACGLDSGINGMISSSLLASRINGGSSETLLLNRSQRSRE